MFKLLNNLVRFKAFSRHAEPPTRLRRCLYVTVDSEVLAQDEIAATIPGWTIDCTNWDDQQGPNWFLYDALILEVPSSADVLNRFALDLEEADATGIRRLWLLQPRTDPAIASRVCGVEITRPRRALPAPPANGRLAAYLNELTEISLVTRPPAGADAVWPIGGSGRWAAGFLATSSGRPVSVVPAKDRPAIEQLGALLDSTTTAPSTVNFKLTESAAVYAVFAIVLAFAATTAALRYHQRSFNISHITADGGTLYTTPYLANLESNAIGSIVQNAATDYVDLLENPAKRLSQRNVEALFDLGFVLQASKGLDALLAADNPRRCSQGQEVGRTLQGLAEFALSAGNRGEARFFAQSHVNLIYRLGCRPMYRLNEPLTRSQTILDMTRQDYISGINTPVAMMLLHPVDRDRMPALPTPSSVDPSLADNIAYAQIAQVAAQDESTPADRMVSWREFLHQHPTSERADEAAFNVIIAQMDQHAVSAESGREAWLEANEATLPMVDEFLSRYRWSYLADDAALLGLRVSATLKRRPSADNYLNAITAVSSTPDALKELEHRLARLLTYMVSGVITADRLAEFCVSKEVLNDTVNLGAVRSGSDPRQAEALRTAEELVGRSNSARALALDVMMRAFAQDENGR